MKMDRSVSPLIIPVESQIRELDSKLLLSCVAAERGFPVILGSRAFVHYKVSSIPRGVYLAKSMRALSIRMFKIMRQLGHDIVAWDEEALVHPPPEIYFTRRLSDVAIKYVSHLFAWGQDNAGLWRQYPGLPAATPIHVTGNPRGDLLRPDLRGYFQDQADYWRGLYGDFILINTNFNDVNPFVPSLGLFLPVRDPGEEPRFGQTGLGMTRQFAEGLWNHKRAVFEDFKRLVPALEGAFPDLTIVVRPHPSENHTVYRDIAKQCQRVRVTSEGNIVPWLLAAKVMIHNGCTTGVEAYALSVPAVAYQATVDEYYDYEFQGLPNRLSHQCFDFEELKKVLRSILAGELGATAGTKYKALFDNYLAAQEERLASERIVDVLETAEYGLGQPPPSSITDYVQGWIHTKARTAVKRINMRRPGHRNSLAYHAQRFPDVSVEEIRRRVARFGRLLNRFDGIRVDLHSKHIFSISG